MPSCRKSSGVCLLLAACCAAPFGCATAPPEAPHKLHFGVIVDAEAPWLAPAPVAPDRPLALSHLAGARMARRAGNFAMARSAAEAALLADPTLGAAHVEWAIAAEELAIERELVRAHLVVGEARADDAEAFLLLGQRAASEGRCDLAVSRGEQALALAPDSVDALVLVGQCRLAQGDVAVALAHFDKAIATSPELLPAWAGVARAKERQGDLMRAEEALRKLIALAPKALIHRSELVAFFRRTGQKKKEKAAQRELDRLAPRDARRLRPLKPHR